jgi:hypothetical protein
LVKWIGCVWVIDTLLEINFQNSGTDGYESLANFS